MQNTKDVIRLIYLYLFSLVGLVLVVVASVSLIDLGLKSFVFTKADQSIFYPEYPAVRGVAEKPTTTDAQLELLTPEQQAKYDADRLAYEEKSRAQQRQRTASNSLAMLIVGIPLFLYHWRKLQNKE